MDYKDMTVDQLEAKQAEIVNWILKFGKTHQRYYQAGKALTQVTIELIRKTDVTHEAKKTAGLIHFAQNYQDPLISSVQQHLM